MKNINNLPVSRLAAAFAFTFLLFSSHSFAQSCPTSITVVQSPDPVCTGQSVTFTASSSGSGGSYIWEANGSSTNTATYIANFSGVILNIEYDVPGVCHYTTYFTPNILPSPEADAGQDGHLTCNPTSVTLGGNPTGQGGSGGLLTYSWSGGLMSSANPSTNIFSYASTTYTVTVTDRGNGCTATSSVTFNKGAYYDKLIGNASPVDGRVVSDMTADAHYLFACGWADQDIYVHNNDLQVSSIADPNKGHFVWVAKYEPCDGHPLRWAKQIGDYAPNCSANNYPTYTNGECTQPFTPNIARDRNGDVYVAYNIDGNGFIAKLDNANGNVLYAENLKGFLITDLIDDGTRVFAAGYAVDDHVQLISGGYFYNNGDIFAAQINTSSSHLSCTMEIGYFGFTLSSYGIPSIAVAAGDSKLFLFNVAWASFFDLNTGSFIGGTPTGISLGQNNARCIIDDAHSKVYMTDGVKIYSFKYQYTGSSWIFTSALNTTAAAPVYDIVLDGNGNIEAMEYDMVEQYDNTLNLTNWQQYSYNNCPASGTGFVNPDGADRCIAIGPGNAVFVGGSEPVSPCVLHHTYSPTDNYGFIARLDDVRGQFFKTTGANTATTEPLKAVKELLNVYPNPTQDVLRVVYSSPDGQGSYSLRNIAGQELAQGVLWGSGIEQSIPTATLPAGLYILQIRGTDKIQTRKIVKE